VSTFIGTPQLLWVQVGVAAHTLHAEIRAGAGYARLYVWLGTRCVATSRETTRHWALMLAQLLEYPPSVLRPAVYIAATPRMPCRVH
jgi:hypothetical protein